MNSNPFCNQAMHEVRMQRTTDLIPVHEPFGT